MSLILDAINRSQRERASPGDVPGVATAHYAGATVAPGAWRLGLLGLALVVALGVIAWLLVRPAPGGIPDTDGEQAAAPALREQSEPDTAPVQAAEPAPEPARAPSAHANAGEEYESDSQAREAQPSEARSAAVPARRESPREVAALYQKADVSSVPGAGEVAANEAVENEAVEGEAVEDATEEAAAGEPLDVEALLVRAQEEMTNDDLQEHPAPFLAELSQQRKDAIPTLLYSKHDFRGDGGGSTVLVNGKTASAGQSVAQGVRVEEILPDSVVLSHDGQSFRLRALNSWVNL